MTANQARKWAQVLGLKLGEAGPEWVHCACPRAPYAHRGGEDRHPSFGMKVMPGESRVHCFGCGFSGWQTTVLIDMEAHSQVFRYAEALDLIVTAEESAGIELDADYESAVFGDSDEECPFPEWVLGAFESAHFGGQVHPYLEKRSTPFEVAKHLDLRFDTFRQRIVFPVRDWESRLMGLHGRTVLADGKPPYLMYPWEGHTNPHVLLGEHWVNVEEPLVVAESVFDLARCFEIYENVVTPLTASISPRELERLVGARRIITLFDGDEAGDQARTKVTEWWDGSVAHVYPPDGADAGDLAPEELEELLTPAIEAW